MKYFSKSKMQSFHSDEQALLKDKLFFINCNQFGQTRFPEGPTAVSVVVLSHLFSPCYCLHSCGAFLSYSPPTPFLQSHLLHSYVGLTMKGWVACQWIHQLFSSPTLSIPPCVSGFHGSVSVCLPYLFFYSLFHWIVSKCQAFDRLRRKNIRNVAQK